MKQIKLLLLLASASVTGALAQSNGLTDMSQSRFAKMANTGIGAVHWTDGFWGDRFHVFSRTSLQSMWNTWNTPEISHGFRNFEIAAGYPAPTHSHTSGLPSPTPLRQPPGPPNLPTRL